MRLLVDTHVVLWQLSGDRRLGPESAAAVAVAESLFFSSVSFAEIGVKASVGKLVVPPGLEETVRAVGLRVLPLTPAHGLAVADLPVLHRDPFDRLLVAQALVEGLTLLTADPRIMQYEIPTVDATA